MQQDIVNVTIPLADSATGDLASASVTMPCLRDVDGGRYFFGPLLVRASHMQRAQSVYRKIRDVTTRRVATDDEMAFVRRAHPRLYERIMHERRIQVAEASRRDRRRYVGRRRVSARVSAALANGGDDAAAAIPTNATVAGCTDVDTPTSINSYTASGTPDDSDGEVIDAGIVDHPWLIDDVGDNCGVNALNQVNGYGDDGDADYDADGAGDLVPFVPRCQSATRGPSGVTARTIYLVEVTSLLVEFLGAGFIAPDAVSLSGDEVWGGPIALHGTKRTWPEIEPAVALWAATREAALVAECDEDPLLSKRARRARKQQWPMRALLPMP